MKLESKQFRASDCRVSKIILNDTKLEPLFWEVKIKNTLVGKILKIPGFNLNISFGMKEENLCSKVKRECILF